MCELLGINSNRPVEMRTLLGLFARRGGETADNPDGWGLAYFDGNDFLLHKAPEAAADSALLLSLSETIRSNLVIAHVRKANPPTSHTLANTHPFVRDCCGRHWVFAHNGKVPELLQSGGCCHPQLSHPLGDTDSEHAFYFLLDEIAGVFTGSDSVKTAIWLQTLAKLSGAIAAYGQFNFLLSDGERLIAYGHDRLHRLQQNHGDHKVTLIASEPLTDENWEVFLPGQLQVYEGGELQVSLQPDVRLAHDPVCALNT